MPSCGAAVFFSVYFLVSALINIVHQCTTAAGTIKDRDYGNAPVFQESNMDILSIDISEHKIQLKELLVQGCDCLQMVSLMQLFEWSLFEISTTILLSLIFFWLLFGSGIDIVKSILKKRGLSFQKGTFNQLVNPTTIFVDS